MHISLPVLAQPSLPHQSGLVQTSTTPDPNFSVTMATLHTAPESAETTLISLLSPLASAKLAENFCPAYPINRLSDLTNQSLLAQMDANNQAAWGMNPSRNYIQSLTSKLIDIAQHKDNSPSLAQAAVQSLVHLISNLSAEYKQVAIAEMISSTGSSPFSFHATPQSLGRFNQVSAQIMQLLQSVAKSEPVLVVKALLENGRYAYRSSNSLDAVKTLLPTALQASPQEVSAELMLLMSKLAPGNQSSRNDLEQSSKYVAFLQNIIVQSGVQEPQLLNLINKINQECNQKLERMNATPAQTVMPATPVAPAPQQP